ncbi:MAG: hypothetical protein QOE36_261 [Gaiellaceae bacterium]|nr:hypothetical protein [Gaiellaceae bacterium]
MSAAPAPSGLRLVWGEEFDGPAGSPVDRSVWTHELGDGTEHGNPGWGNDELQRYTDLVDNSALDGSGNLAITARLTPGGFTSARLVTKDKVHVRYGRIEARAAVPRGAGLWPAIWALGASIDEASWPRCGEIDVMEHVGREPRRVYGTLHGPGYSRDECFGGTHDLDRDVAEDFHAFAVDWEPGHIAWTVDDTVYHEARPADLAPHPWVFDQPVFLILNLAVGGSFGGAVDDATAFPQDFLVDYVRVFERDGTGGLAD